MILVMLQRFFSPSLLIILFFTLGGALFVHPKTLAEETGDLFFESSSFRVSPATPVVGKSAKIYISLKNTSTQDMKGVVRAFDMTEEKKIEVEQTFTTLANGKADIFLEFSPEKSGNHEVVLRIIPWEQYSQNNTSNDKISEKFFVDIDTDGDGIGNSLDVDDDNDGTKDGEDKFPLNPNESKDFDEDNIGDNEDDDDDNDGIKDNEDAFPFDPLEKNDLDGDGIGNNEDDDDDGDGVRDDAEIQNGTDPEKKDTDDDGVSDALDDYPLDDKYQFDTDKDGTPNADDNDDDNDGIRDEIDLFPLNKDEWEDFDGDEIGDFSDPDDDNDGLLDEHEKLAGSNPFDPDTDDDGVIDGKDAMPLDPWETQDSDNDGVGNNGDTNDNNKGPVLIYTSENTQTEERSWHVTSVFNVERKEAFVLDTTASYDPEGSDIQFLWEILDKNDAVIASTDTSYFTVKFSGIGEKKLRLTLRDEADEIRVKNFIILVSFSSQDWIIISLIIILLAGGSGGYFFWRKKQREAPRSQ
jgi:hypothetical protein